MKRAIRRFARRVHCVGLGTMLTLMVVLGFALCVDTAEAQQARRGVLPHE